MLNFILKHLFKFAVEIVSRKVNLPPNIAQMVNSAFNTNFNNIKVDIKTDKKQLISLLSQAKSEDEANKIREVLKEQDKRKQLPFKLLALGGIIVLIAIPFNVSLRSHPDELWMAFFLGFAILFALYRYYIYIRTSYQCKHCFTTDRIANYPLVDLKNTASFQSFSSNTDYMGHDNHAHYYETRNYQTTTQFFDRTSQCPCCGHIQMIKTVRRQTSQI